MKIIAVSDDKGFVGIYSEDWKKEVLPLYCLRPDKVSITSNLKCNFHGIPRQFKKARKDPPKRIRESLEWSIYNTIRSSCLEAGIDELEWKRKIRKNSIDPDANKLRRKYFAIVDNAYAKTNSLLFQARAVADQDALKLARRFEHDRNRAYAFATRSLRCRQFLETFPALGLKIIKSGGIPTSGNVFDDYLERIEAGDKLKNIANMFDLPMCLRKVKPQAAHLALDLLNNYINDISLINKLVNDYLPKTTMRQYRFLYFLKEARANNDNILWLAKSLNFNIKLDQLFNLGSTLQDYMRGEFIEGVRPFNAKMELGTATIEAQRWHQLLNQRQWNWASSLKTTIPLETKFPEPWLPEFTHQDHYVIKPLLTYSDLIKESADMHHCVRTYADYVLDGKSYIYTVFKDEKKVATLELRKNQLGIYLAQLRGPCNNDPVPAIKNVVQKWLDLHVTKNTNETHEPLRLPYNARWLAGHADLAVYDPIIQMDLV